MRYEDASQMGSGQVDARNDADHLAARDYGPATGNVISGTGTITGSAGLDIAGGTGRVTAIDGAGGSDTSFSAGKLSVEGQYGTLTMDARGNYSYERDPGTPAGVSDIFHYTLSTKAGATDNARLVINIGDLPKLATDATRVVPGADGVVTLPPGVELSDIRVVGRDLVVTLPDGSTMIIVDGAIFVPQLVLGGVEVPASNLAALLIGSEPRPAAGDLAGNSQSSGGNFGVPVAPLDPGVPLGDLLPPTELDYTPPEVDELFDIFEDEDPIIAIQPDGQPASVAAVDLVEEAGLPTRNGGEPAGSGEIADGNGSNNSITSETTAGTILYDSPDGVDSITLNGVVIASVGQVIAGTFGTMTITSIASGAIGYSYTLLDNTSGDDTHDDFSVVLTDTDGDQASATLVIDIIDDVPTARPDIDTLAIGEFVATGNVMTDAALGDAGDPDTNAADTVGADNARVTFIDSVNAAPGANVPDGNFVDIAGQYGNLRIFSNGDYTYTRGENSPGGVQDVFNYTLTDGDGDTSTTTLTINIPDTPILLTFGNAVSLDDDARPGGNPGGPGDDNPDTANTVGVLNIQGGDGNLIFALRTDGAPAGFTYELAGNGNLLIKQGGVTVITVTLDASTGAYTVTQNAPIDHPALNGGAEDNTENNLVFPVIVRVTDADGDFVDATGQIIVDDDTPTLVASGSEPNLVVDDTTLGNDDTAAFGDGLSVSFGADGPAASNPISYAMGLNAGATGLFDTATGAEVVLTLESGVVVGRAGAGGAIVFTVSVDGSGNVTLDQQRAVVHNDPADPVETGGSAATLAADNLVTVSIVATDRDGDEASLTVNIGQNLRFEDDGPTALQAQLTGTVDEDGIVEDVGDDGDGVAGGPPGAGSFADVPGEIVSATGNVGALFASGNDLPLTYSLTNNFAGLEAQGLTSQGVPLSYSVSFAAGVHTLTASAPGGNVIFTFTLNATTGAYNFTLLDQLDHPTLDDLPGDNLENDLAIQLGSIIQATDGDGDSVTALTGEAGGLVIIVDDDTPVALNDSNTLSVELDALAVTSIVAEWTDVVLNEGSANETDNDADGAIDEIRWGEPDETDQSGYAFVDNPDLVSQNVLTNQQFIIGTFTHFNEPVFDQELLSTVLVVNFTAVIGGESVNVGPIAIEFQHDETPNTGTDLENRDIITITPQTTTVVINGVEYELEVLGLVDEMGNVVTEVRTLEGQANSYDLAVRFVSLEAFNVTGNVITNDESGADEPIGVVAASGFGDSADSVADGMGNYHVDGQYGTLTINTDGSYTYALTTDPDLVPDGAFETFTYSIEDADGDGTTAELVINLEIDRAPTLDAPDQGEAGTAVSEVGLPPRGGEPAGTGEASDGNPNNNSNTSETTAGLITFTAPDGPAVVRIDGVIVTGVVGQTFAGAHGTLTITSYNAGTGQIGYSYTLADNTSGNATFDDFAISVTDADGDVANDTLVVNITDDAPLAVNDTDAVAAGSNGPATGNVLTGVEVAVVEDGNASDGVADNPGADGGLVSFIDNSQNGAPGVAVPNGGSVVIAGQYGSLTIFSNGDYSYARTPGQGGGQNEVFTYTLLDGDGDTTTATLTISIGDSPVTLDAPDQGEAGTAVSEVGLPPRGGEPAGTGEASDGNPNNNSNTSETTAGLITFTAPDGPAVVRIDGVIVTGVVGQTFAGAHGTLTITSYNAGTGQIGYSYTLADNTSGNATFDDFAISVTDADGDVANDTLVVNITDDAPLAVNDTDAVAAGSNGPATGNVLTGVEVAVVEDGNASDGVADNPGADGGLVSFIDNSQNGAPGVAVPNGGSVVIAGQYGSLTIFSNGDYSYARTPGQGGGQNEVFTYTLLDGDGDTTTATLTISIGDSPVTLDAPDQGEAGTAVSEVGLPPRGGEPAGTGEASDGNPNNNSNTSETTAGLITFTAPDGPAVVRIDGVIVTGVVGQTFAGAHGTLTITSYNAGTGQIGYSYTLADNTSGNATFDDFAISVTDADGDVANDTLVVNITDDAPLAVNDTDAVAAGSNGPATGNVLTGVEVAVVEDGNASDGVADNPGADGGLVSFIDNSQNGAPGVAVPNGGSVVIAGQYGSLTIFSNGDYSYARTPGQGGGQNEVFTYTLLDGDGDTTTATLTISIGDSPVTLDAPDQGEAGTAVSEVGLPPRGGEPAGTGEASDGNPNNNSNTSETTAGLITFTAPDGPAVVRIDGVIVTGVVGQTFAGAHGTLTITSYNAGTGQIGYSYTLADNTSGNATFDDFAISVTDADGDVANDTLVVNITDDAPLAVNDTDAVAAGSNGPATGNVLTGVEVAVVEDGNASDGVADNPGADGGLVSFIDNSQNGAPGVAVPNGGSVVIAGQYGSLTIFSNGDYSYARTPGQGGGQNEVFTYTLLDGDGDTTTATLTISIGDSSPTAGSVNVQLDDETLAGGNDGGIGDVNPNLVNVSGNLPGSGGDGALTWDLLLTGAPAGFSYVDGPAGAVHVLQGATHVVTITVNAATGAYTVTQIAPIDHPDGLNENNVSFTVNYTVTDADGDPANGTINIDVDDDTPTIDVTKTAGEASILLTTQDTETDGTPTTQDTAASTANFSGVFGLSFSAGADGAVAPTLAYSLATVGGASGLASGGLAINLYLIGGKVVGSTAVNLGGVNAGNSVFDIGVNGTGVVTLTQYSQIDHTTVDPSPTGTPFADHVAVLANGLVTLTASSTITDGDNDTASDNEVIDLGGNIRFEDDGPDVSAVLTGTQIRIDETDGVVAAGGEVDPVGGNLGTVTLSAATLFTVTQPNVSADSPTALSYALILSAQGVASGLLVSSNNAPIFLYDMGGGVIAGSTSATLPGVNAGNTAFNVSINPGTGAVTLTQFLAIEHGNVASVDEDSSGLAAGALSVRVTATDFDGDTDQSSVDLGSVIRFEDDGPSASLVQLTGTVDEDGVVESYPAPNATRGDGVTGGANGVPGATGDVTLPNPETVATGSVATLFQSGADVPLTYSLLTDTSGLPALLSQGVPVTYLVVGNTLTASAGVGNTVFTFVLNANGTYTFTLVDQLDHPTLNGIAGDNTENDLSINLSSLIQATDADGDSVSAGANGLIITVDDDVPVAVNDTPTLIVEIDDLEVANIVAEWVEWDLDPNGNPTQVDVDGDGATDDISWGTGSSGPSRYGFVDNPDLATDTVLTNTLFSLGTFTHYNRPINGAELNNVTLEVTFTAIINGVPINVGPIEIFFDHDETPNTGNAEQNRDIITINQTTTVIDIGGVEYELQVEGLVNEMGDVVTEVRTFEGQANSYELLVRFVPTDSITLEGNVLANDLSGADETIDVVAATGFGGSSDNVPNGSNDFEVVGQYGTLTINVDGSYSYRLTTDREDVPEGAVEHFTYTIEDFDGDRQVAELDITIDPTPVPPVVLDMDGDGVEFIGQSSGVSYDYGAGVVATAWAGADDAILVRDANGNGLVDNASEFVFGGNGMTDLEALHAQYGSQLDASDADFVMFAVWNDANSNGVVDANEMQSLAEAGIVSIDLVSDGVAYSAANGEVDVAGTATFTRTDGSTGDVADAIFATGGRSMMETQRVAANSNNVVLAAAVAAAGLAVSAPAAASVDGAEVATGRIPNAAVTVEAFDMSILGLATETAMPALMGEMRDSFGTVEIPFQSAQSRDFGTSIGELGSGHFDSMAPTALLQGSDILPGQVAMPMLASNVAMPSAEALIAMAGQGNVESTETVETIVADALQGGGGPDINALLNALPTEGIAVNAGTDSLASPGSGFVPTWDTGPGAGFTFAGANVMSNEALVLHHDAIQPVANG